jgi:hypothetical protein
MAFEFEGAKGVEGWKRSWRLYKEGMEVYLMLVAPDFLMFLLASMFPFPFPTSQATTQLANELEIENLHYYLLLVFFRCFVHDTMVIGAMIRATAEIQVGRQPNAVSCWLKSLSKAPTSILAYFIAMPIIWFGSLFFLIPGWIFVVGTKFTKQIVHLQSHSASGSLLGSWKLTTGHRWAVVWVEVWDTFTTVALLGLGAFELQILTILLLDPLGIIFQTNLYIGLRGEKEGLDTETLKRELDNDSRSPLPQENGPAQDINEQRDTSLGNLEDGIPSATSDTEQQPANGSPRKCGIYVVVGLIGIVFLLPFIFVAVTLSIQPAWLSRINERDY